MSESIRTVWDWEIGDDRYYYEMPAFDSVHAKCSESVEHGPQLVREVKSGGQIVGSDTTVSLSTEVDHL